MIAPAEIKINGAVFGTVTDFDLVADIYAMGTTFDMSVVPGQGQAQGLPVPGDIAEVLIDGCPYLKGVVLEATSEVSGGNRSVRISGCDYAGLLDISQLEATISPAKMSVIEFAKKACGALGDLLSFGYAPGAKEKDQGYIERSEIGSTLSTEIGKVAHGRGLIAWCEVDGKIVFGTLAGVGKPEYRIVADKSGTGGVLRSRVSRSIKNSSGKIIVASQIDKEDGKPSFAIKTFDVPGYPAGLPTVRAGRRNSGDGTVTAMADAMIAEMQRDMLQLEYDLVGFSNCGKPWMINRLVSVTDDWHGERIAETMLITKVRFGYSVGGGAVASVTLARTR